MWSIFVSLVGSEQIFLREEHFSDFFDRNSFDPYKKKIALIPFKIDHSLI